MLLDHKSGADHFIQSDQLKLIMKQIRDNFRFINLSYIYDPYLVDKLKKDEEWSRQAAERISQHDEKNEYRRDGCLFMVGANQDMQDSLRGRNADMLFNAAKYQVVSTYGEFFGKYFKQLLDYIDFSNID